jgi:hypothetical protein
MCIWQMVPPAPVHHTGVWCIQGQHGMHIMTPLAGIWDGSTWLQARRIPFHTAGTALLNPCVACLPCLQHTISLTTAPRAPAKRRDPQSVVLSRALASLVTLATP